MGRDRAHPLRRDWEAVKVEVMTRAVRAKFEQHDDLRALLLDTRDALIVEHTEPRRPSRQRARGSARAKASRRGPSRTCSSRNTKLLGDGEVLDGFRALVRRPADVGLIDLEALLDRAGEVAPPELGPWARALAARYGRI